MSLLCAHPSGMQLAREARAASKFAQILNFLEDTES